MSDTTILLCALLRCVSWWLVVINDLIHYVSLLRIITLRGLLQLVYRWVTLVLILQLFILKVLLDIWVWNHQKWLVISIEWATWECGISVINALIYHIHCTHIVAKISIDLRLIGVKLFQPFFCLNIFLMIKKNSKIEISFNLSWCLFKSIFFD